MSNLTADTLRTVAGLLEELNLLCDVSVKVDHADITIGFDDQSDVVVRLLSFYTAAAHCELVPAVILVAGDPWRVASGLLPDGRRLILQVPVTAGEQDDLRAVASAQVDDLGIDP